MHRCSRNDHTFSFLWLVPRGCLPYPCFGRRGDRCLILVSDLEDIFRQIPCFSAGASFLLQGFFPCSFLELWRTRNALLRLTLLHNSLRWTLFFPNFLRGAMYGEFDSVIRSQFPPDSCNKATDPFPPLFFDILLGCPPVCERTLVALFASRFRLEILTHGRMPKITRRFRTLSSEKFVCVHALDPFNPDGLSPLRPEPFEGFSSVSLCQRFTSRRGRLCFLVHDSIRGSNYKTLLVHTVQLLSTDGILPLFFSTLISLPFFDS